MFQFKKLSHINFLKNILPHVYMQTDLTCMVQLTCRALRSLGMQPNATKLLIIGEVFVTLFQETWLEFFWKVPIIYHTLLHCQTSPDSRNQLLYLPEGTVDSEVAWWTGQVSWQANGVLSCGRSVGQEALMIQLLRTCVPAKVGVRVSGGSQHPTPRWRDTIIPHWVHLSNLQHLMNQPPQTTLTQGSADQDSNDH